MNIAVQEAVKIYELLTVNQRKAFRASDLSDQSVQNLADCVVQFKDNTIFMAQFNSKIDELDRLISEQENRKRELLLSHAKSLRTRR